MGGGNAGVSCCVLPKGGAWVLGCVRAARACSSFSVHLPLRQPLHRLSSATPRNAESMWAPQPDHDGLPQVEHGVWRHIAATAAGSCDDDGDEWGVWVVGFRAGVAEVWLFTRRLELL